MGYILKNIDNQELTLINTQLSRISLDIGSPPASTTVDIITGISASDLATNFQTWVSTKSNLFFIHSSSVIYNYATNEFNLIVLWNYTSA